MNPFNRNAPIFNESLRISHLDGGMRKIINLILFITFCFLCTIAVTELIVNSISALNEESRYWASMRLSILYAFLNGESFFSTPNRPPWTINSYGPASFLYYLPLSLLSSQEHIIFTAKIIGYFIILFPMCLFYRLISKSFQLTRIESISLFTIGILFTIKLESFSYIHTIDAPTTCSILFSLYLIIISKSKTHVKSFVFLSGLLLGIAVSCKIIVLTALPAMAIISAEIHHQRFSKQYFKSLLIYFLGCVTSISIFYGYAIYNSGFEALVLQFKIMNYFGILNPKFAFNPNLNKYSTSNLEKIQFLSIHIFHYISSHFISIVMALLGSIVLWDRYKKTEVQLQFIQPIYPLLLCLSIFPPCLMAMFKYGGAPNSLLPVDLLFQISVLVLTTYLYLKLKFLYKTLMIAFVIAFSSVHFGGTIMRVIRNNSSQVIIPRTELAKQINHVYFPMDPLYHILKDNRFLGSADVFHCMEVSGHPVEQSELLAHLPPELTHVAIPNSMVYLGMEAIERMLPKIETSEPPTEIEHHLVWRFR